MSLQVVDHAESTFSTGVDDATSSWPLSDASKFPVPNTQGVGPYWVWAWNEGSFALPKDDPNAERARVTNKVGDTLTVVRGEDGQTAAAHSSGYTVAMLADAANVLSARDIIITPFGGDTTGASDATAAIQAAYDAAIASKRPLYIPTGTFRINGTIEATDTSSNLFARIVGDHGRGSVLLDNNLTGPMFRFDSQQGTLIWENVGVKANDFKWDQSHIEINDSRTGDHKFYGFYYQGNQKAVKYCIDLTDTWNVTFFDPTFTQWNGIAIHQQNNTLNGGNLRIFGGHFNQGRCGLYTYGNSTNNSIVLEGTKFAFNQSCDYKRLTSTEFNDASGAWTIGQTGIFIGKNLSGLSPNSHIIHIVNNNQHETKTAQSYDSGTGVLTLRTGLDKDWTGQDNAEIFYGCFSFISSIRSPNIVLNGTHHEQCPIILGNSPAPMILGSLHTFDQSVAVNKGVPLTTGGTADNLYGIYLVGGETVHASIVSPFYTTDRADKKLVAAVKTFGTSNIPSPHNVISPVHNVSGGLSIPTDQQIWTGFNNSNIKFFIMTGNTIGGTTTLNPAVMNLAHTRRAVTTVSDADYTILSTGTENVVFFNTMTTGRTCTLPGTPNVGRWIKIIKGAGTTGDVTIARNGNLINGVAAGESLTVANSEAEMVWVGGSTGWILNKETNP